MSGIQVAALTCLKASTCPAFEDATMELEHGHSKEEIAARLAPGMQTRYLRDVVYGGIDGAVTTFAIVAGVQGAGLSPHIIVALGVANILADGFSMAAGNYSGTKADLDDRKRLQAIEERHITEAPDGEREELRQILYLRGLSGPVLADATDAIASNRDKWIEIMLTDEYGLSLEVPRPLQAALATFIAFLIAGSVPLIPFLLGLSQAFTIAMVATGVTFFVIGTAKSYWSLSRWWRSGAETLLIGALAASIAYFVGSLFHI
jgi:VIT1/CCC1 family predicted Fe2+/Mn2+ transporter